MPGYAAVVLAGGAGRRLGGLAKPTLELGGRSLLDRVLAAAGDARPRVVVGPPSLTRGLPLDIAVTSEQPPGGGPAAGAAAGLALVPPGVGYVALLAADLPFLSSAALADLRRVAAAPTLDGALFTDAAGRRQSLCSVWRVAALVGRLAELRARRGRLAGVALREVIDGLRIGQIPSYRRPGAEPGPPPWFDCDTEADLTEARRWFHDSQQREQPE